MKSIDQLRIEAIEAGVKVKTLENVLELARQKSQSARSAYLGVAHGWQAVLDVEAEIGNRAARQSTSTADG
jgi:hypothetical protein